MRVTVERICRKCGKTFNAMPCEVKRGGGIFCSKLCAGVHPGTLEERFWMRVNKTETCWLWIGRKNNMGYGMFSLPQHGHKAVSVLAHRYAYELLVGPILEAKPKLDHLCRVPLCVNPAHLEPVTQRENVMRGDSFMAKLAKSMYCQRGHEFTSENTRINELDGTRTCKACERLRRQVYEYRQRGWEVIVA